MTFHQTALAGSYIIDLQPFKDNRGWFARYYCKDEFKQIGHTSEWLQLNHSFTEFQGTIRGMHFQLPPFSEIKLVRCISGSVFDVIVDLRENSPTFLHWIGQELSAENKKMLYIPQGFAHGFQTLTDRCELLYHHSANYTPAVEAGIRYDDPTIGIEWPLRVDHISERDGLHPLLPNDFKGI